MNKKCLIQRSLVSLNLIASVLLLSFSPVFAGDFTPANADGLETVSGDISSNGQTGTYTLTRTNFISYGLVNFQGGSEGIQAANQNLFEPNVGDVYTYNFSVTPPLGYVARISVKQAPYATGGNSESSLRTLTWVGGGNAIISDEGTATRADVRDADFPPYNTFNSGCPDNSLRANQNQIYNKVTGDSIASGEVFTSLAVENTNALWEITLPDGVNDLALNNETIANSQFPAYQDNTGLDNFGPNSTPCLEYSNLDGAESVQEWISFDVEFIAQQPTSVPTLSQWMLIFLSIMLMFIGYKEGSKKLRQNSFKF